MSTFLSNAAFMMIFAAMTLFMLLVFSRSMAILVSKAYRPVGSAWGMLGIFFGLFGMGLWIALTRFNGPPPHTFSMVRAVIQVCGSYVLAMAGMAAVASALPRQAHRSGPKPRRWVDWRITGVIAGCAPWIGGGLIVTGLVGLKWFSSKSLGLNLVRDGLYLLGAQKLFTFLRGVEKKPTATQLVAQDARPPVLYIRAFQYENSCFTYGRKDVLAKYVAGQVTFMSPAFVQLNLEQYLGSSLEQMLGPFIGLGNPRDYQRTGGAARDYLTDGGWRESFLEYAGRARAIVMQPTVSKQLNWELSEIVSRGWQTKLVIVQRPSPKSRGRVTRWMFESIAWAQYSRRPDWETFVAWMAGVGLRLPREEPGAGAVLGFDAHGNGVPVTTGAQEPEEFVGPMQAWLEESAQR